MAKEDGAALARLRKDSCADDVLAVLAGDLAGVAAHHDHISVVVVILYTPVY
jgi:hypothetical protein